ncbi:HGGxSTG domain-containing protein [Microbacterium sp. 22179]|uniref:HGGxSTG domain-containing protein n=1 Tax=Microbacterium sp. 22179 TaxID=3453886 RepID=UPI003F832DD5
MTDQKKRRGGPPPKGLEDRKHSGTLCTATRRDGTPCTNFALTASSVCRMHGGSAPQVRRAAQVRILMASDLAARKMVELMSNPKVDDRVKLAAAKDLLDRANLAGTQNIEVGVTKRTFEDFIGDAIIDVEEDEDGYEPLPAIPDEVIEDANVVDDEPPLNRHDRAMLAEVERAHSRRARPDNNINGQRARAEADLMVDQRHAEHLERQAEVDREREAVLLAKMNGTWNPSSRGEAMREAAKQGNRKRRARVRDDGMGES